MNKETITSLQNKLIKDVCSLKENKNIKEKHMFLVENYHLIEMAKDNLLFVLTTKELDLNPNINQVLVNEEVMKKCSLQKSTAKCIGVCKELHFNFKLDDTLIYLDGIQDPGNLGTILRTALGLGIKNILISKNSCSIYNYKVIQSSQGAIFNLNIKIVDETYINSLKEMGYRIVSTALSKKSIALNSLEYKEKTVLVFGNEGNGIKESTLNLSDELIIIPIKDIDSFNVGISFGIVAYTYLNKINN